MPETSASAEGEGPGGAAFLLYACFFLSGAAALAYEVAWLRSLELIFGGTSHAAATVLAAFMAGLALGSYAFGRHVRRWIRPLRIYAWLELGIGLYAILVPFIFAALEPLYGVLWAGLGFSPLFFGVARFAVCFVVLVPATVLMGATLPVVSQHWSRQQASVVGGVGRLYGFNTLGAMVGVFATGFFVLPALGYTATIGAAVVVNFLVAAAAFELSRRLEGTAPEEPPPAEVASPAVGAAAAVPGVEVVVAVALAFTGFAAMVLQVGWTRMLGLVIGPSVYAFAIMLGTFLVGLALGSLVVSWGLDKLRWNGERTFWILAAVTGLLSLTTLGFAAELPYLFARLFFRWGGDLATATLFAIEAVVCGAAIFLPTLAMGGLFPAGLAAAGLSREHTGASVGRLYAANTVGAVMGAFAGGFLLIPAVGLSSTIVGASFIYVSVGAVFGFGMPGWSLRPAAARAVAVSVAGFATLVLLPAWNPAIMTSGIYRYVSNLTEDFDREEFRDLTEDSWELLYYRDGPTSTITVALQPNRMEELGGEEVPNIVYMTDGKVDASSVGDMRTQVLLGQAPMLLHPDPRAALVIGLASGTTAGSVLTHPLERLDIIEIEPASEDASRLFDFVNGRPLDDARTTLHFGDARSFLRGTDARYDVIVSEPSNPWMAGPANLFTREFFELGRQALNPGGVFTQWIHTYSLHPELLRSTLATFQSVFPYVFAFGSGTEGDLVLVGTADPTELDVARISARWQVPAVQRDLARVELPEFGDVMARVRMGPEEFAGLAMGARINTDDNGLLLFGAPLFVHASTVVANDRLLGAASRGVGEYLSFPGATPEIEARFFYYLASAYGTSGLPVAAAVARRLAADRDEAAPSGSGG